MPIALCNDDERQHMLKTMRSFGFTENLQLSGSFQLAMQDGNLALARMMSAMSSGHDSRYWRPIGLTTTVAIDGRQESTFYVGGTAPFERSRNGISVGPSLEAGISTGYASRAHYVWLGGAVQRFFERETDPRAGEAVGSAEHAKGWRESGISARLIRARLRAR